MPERHLDFDTIIKRKGTNSLKYDFAGKRGKPEDLLPLWVADMDFKISSYITDAIEDVNNLGIYGYSDSDDEYFNVLDRWMKNNYEFNVKCNWLIKTPGIVFALATAVRAYTNINDAVMIQIPVYYPFSEVVIDNKRKLVSNTLIQDETGRYKMDFEDFRNKIIEHNIKMFILCNPHNPVGRVWTRDELTIIGDICLENNVIVVSDEIHADFVFKGKHNVFSSVKKEYEDISVICTSPSKSFNIAGLQVSNIWIPNQNLRRKFKNEISSVGYSQLNSLGIVACKAAYENGEKWLDGVKSYIKDNAIFVKKFLQENLPKIKMTGLEGTYLVWLDFRGYELSDKEINRIIIEKAKLWLDDGEMFGEAGKGFQRINIACPRSILEEALVRLHNSF